MPRIKNKLVTGRYVVSTKQHHTFNSPSTSDIICDYCHKKADIESSVVLNDRFDLDSERVEYMCHKCSDDFYKQYTEGHDVKYKDNRKRRSK